MFPTSLLATVALGDITRHLHINLLELLSNEVDSISVADTAVKDDLYFIRIKRFSVSLSAQLNELYVARVRFEGEAGKRQLSYTLYDLQSAPLDTARCPRELVTRLSVAPQDTQSQVWLAENDAYNTSVETLATIEKGDVVFVPSGMALSEGREFFLVSTGEGAF